jgi:hypothetical protein
VRLSSVGTAVAFEVLYTIRKQGTAGEARRVPQPGVSNRARVTVDRTTLQELLDSLVGRQSDGVL